jgi:hypothetical protein
MSYYPGFDRSNATFNMNERVSLVFSLDMAFAKMPQDDILVNDMGSEVNEEEFRTPSLAQMRSKTRPPSVPETQGPRPATSYFWSANGIFGESTGPSTSQIPKAPVGWNGSMNSSAIGSFTSQTQSCNPFAQNSQAEFEVPTDAQQAPSIFDFGPTISQYIADRPPKAVSSREDAHTHGLTEGIAAAHDFFKPTPFYSFGSLPQYKVRNFIEHAVDFMLPVQDVQSKVALVANLCQSCQEMKVNPEDVTPRTWTEMLDDPGSKDVVKFFLADVASHAVENIRNTFQQMAEKTMLLNGAMASMERRAQFKARSKKLRDLETVAGQASRVYRSKATEKTHRELFSDLLASTLPSWQLPLLAVEQYYYSAPGKFDTPIGCTWVQLVQHEQACGSRCLAAVLAGTVYKDELIETIQEKLYKSARSAAAALVTPKPGRSKKEPVRPAPVAQAPVPTSGSLTFSAGTETPSGDSHQDVKMLDAPTSGSSQFHIQHLFSSPIQPH